MLYGVGLSTVGVFLLDMLLVWGCWMLEKRYKFLASEEQPSEIDDIGPLDESIDFGPGRCGEVFPPFREEADDLFCDQIPSKRSE